jgi:hypothetical protein
LLCLTNKWHKAALFGQHLEQLHDEREVVVAAAVVLKSEKILNIISFLNVLKAS